jgi:hypothetical protein
MPVAQSCEKKHCSNPAVVRNPCGCFHYVFSFCREVLCNPMENIKEFLSDNSGDYYILQFFEEF